tara:strand:- start:5305 stop:6498 length:1194 start_codon:yes stop_codon:yes gene_type:complete
VKNILNSSTSYEVECAIGIQFDFNPEKGKDEDKWVSSKGKPWSRANEATTKFAEQIHEKFDKKPREFAQFSKPFTPRSIALNIQEGVSCDRNSEFIEKIADDILGSGFKKQLNNSQLESGFVLVAICYSRNREEFIETASEDDSETNNKTIIKAPYFQLIMLRNSEQLKFDEDQKLEEISVIDFSKLVQGCRINFDEFESVYIDGSKDIDPIQFISGRNEVREYFYNAVGVSDLSINKNAFNLLTKVSRDYLQNEIGYDPIQQSDMEVKLDLYYSSLPPNETISLEDVQEEIERLIPSKDREGKASFVKYANDSEYQLGDKITLSQKIIDGLKRVPLNFNGYQVRIKRSDIGLPGSGKPVVFEKDGNSATITLEKELTELQEITKLESFAKNSSEDE